MSTLSLSELEKRVKNLRWECSGKRIELEGEENELLDLEEELATAKQELEDAYDRGEADETPPVDHSQDIPLPFEDDRACPQVATETMLES